MYHWKTKLKGFVPFLDYLVDQHPLASAFLASLTYLHPDSTTHCLICLQQEKKHQFKVDDHFLKGLLLLGVWFFKIHTV